MRVKEKQSPDKELPSFFFVAQPKRTSHVIFGKKEVILLLVSFFAIMGIPQTLETVLAICLPFKLAPSKSILTIG